MAGNVLNLYDPLFYAQEALIQLEKQLGMAGRVHRGYDKDPQQKGSTIKINKPGTFTAQDAPSSAQDIEAGNVDITLSYWREVKFALTDKELTFTTQKIIDDHIRPAAYALADDIDQKLCSLYKDIPWYTDVTATAAVTDVVAMRKVLSDNKVPGSQRHLMLATKMEADLLGLAAFSQQQGAGDQGVSTQGTGSLGPKFGFEVFTNQNAPSHTSGVAADATGVAGVAVKGATTIGITGLTAAGTVKKGDHFVIAGNTQRYAFTADKTADGSGVIADATFTPPLAAATVGSEVLTIKLQSKQINLGFHRNAFALAMAPLSEMGNGLGARIATIADPITNLALRSRIYYVGNDSKIYVALDVLYGVKTLDPNLAVRGEQ